MQICFFPSDKRTGEEKTPQLMDSVFLPYWLCYTGMGHPLDTQHCDHALKGDLLPDLQTFYVI